MRHQIVIGQAGLLDQDLLDGMHRLRDLVFRQRLGWQVNSENGLECDLYDRLNPFYLIAFTTTRRVDGCWRLLPTTGSYMLKDTFPQLLGAESPPRSHHQWELSRFAIRPQTQQERRQAHLGILAVRMAQVAFCFAENQGIRQYVTVTSVAVERMFRSLGIAMSRLGDGRAQRIGATLTVACRIDLNADCRAALFTPPAVKRMPA